MPQPISYKNDDKQDERLNPASDTARDLQRQERDSIPGYDRRGDGLDDHPITAGDASGESRDPSKNITDTQDRENRAENWTNNVTGQNQQSASGKISGRRRKGPLATIIALLLGGGGALSILLTPGIGLVQLKEIMTEDLNDQFAGMDIRTDHMLRAKLRSMDKSFGVCTGVKIRCQFNTMSDKQIEKFKKAGIQVEPYGDKTGVLGRTRIAALIVPDGTPEGRRITDPGQLTDLTRRNPAAASALRKAFNPKFAGLSDKVALKVLGRFNTDKSQKVTGSTDAERDASITEATKGETANLNANGTRTDTDGREYVVDTEGNKVYAEGEATAPNRVSQEDFNDIAENNRSIAGRAADASAGNKATSSVLTAGLKGVSITGAADTACTVNNTARAVAAAAKTARALQLAQYAMVFLNTADRIKSGDATPEEVTYLGDKLTAVDTTEFVEDESSIKGANDDGSLILEETNNPYYGQAAFDSPGYKVAAYNEAPTLTSRDLQYTIGGGLTGALSSVLDEIANVLGGRENIRDKCKVVQSWWVRGTGLLVGLVAGAGSFGLATGISVGASVAIGFALPFLQAALANIIAGTVVNGETEGVDTGDAVFAGSAALLGGMAQGHGMKPASSEDFEEYLAATNEVKQNYIAMEQYEARSTPFDVMNQYSFLGSMVRSVNPIIMSSSADLAGILTAGPSLLGAAFSSVLPRASAAPLYNPDRFNKCQDPGYEELGIDADIFCNVRYAMSNEELNMDSEVALNWMLENDQIDPDTGAAKDDSTPDDDEIAGYAYWLEKCVDREDGWGDTSKDDGVSDDDIGQFCMEDGDYKYYRVYTMDYSINDTMDNGIPDPNQAQAVSSPVAAGGENGTVSSDGWAYPTTPDGIITSGYKSASRPGHRGLDIAQPGSALNKPIFAVRDGVVTRSGPASGFGNWIIVEHNVNGEKIDSVYGHMYNDGLLVKVGDQVRAGQQIGKIGSNGQSTGPHLHFELWRGGRFGGSEMDPTAIVNGAKG